MIDYIQEAKSVINTEIEGLKAIRDDLGKPFIDMVDLCLETLRRDGKLVLSGVGKSGHIGYKLSATLASLGARAAFLNPVEALHGDLGMLSSKDLVIALSYSGETDELIPLMPAVKRFGVKVVAITGSADSRLAEWADLTVPMPIPQEACPFKLAPTTSTTALLALGDALAIVLLKAQGFSKEQYGMFHPGGSIGRAVTLRVKDIMRSGDRLALVPKGLSVSDTLVRMTETRSGSVVVVDGDNKLLGIFTDGDFRRHVQEDMANLLSQSIGSVMTLNPTTICAEAMAVALMKILEERHIDDIPVLDEEGKVVGLIDIQDLPRFKLL